MGGRAAKPRPGPGAAALQLQPLGVKRLSTVTPRYRSNRAEPSASPSLPPRGLPGGRNDQVEQMELEVQGPTRQGKVCHREAPGLPSTDQHMCARKLHKAGKPLNSWGPVHSGRFCTGWEQSAPEGALIWTHQTNQRTPVRTKLSPRNLTTPQSRAQDLQKPSAPRQKFQNVCSQRSKKT